MNAGQLLIIPAYDIDKAYELSAYQYTTHVEPDPIFGVDAMGPMENDTNRIQHIESASSPFIFLLKSVPPGNECVSVNTYSVNLLDGRKWGPANMLICQQKLWQKFTYTNFNQIQGVFNIDNVKEQHQGAANLQVNKRVRNFLNQFRMSEWQHLHGKRCRSHDPKHTDCACTTHNCPYTFLQRVHAKHCEQNSP